ncbi:MAG: NAD(P)-binding domain-containing protein, partial [Alphaproteobacteria bacterium]|nr:NAD(P)-binding domain-containing protein [Alphaproteobacteria bacterium]
MSPTEPFRVAVIGAGAWGTALAAVARRAGHAVTLQAHEPEVAAAINDRQENPLYLPGIALDPTIRATADPADAAAGATMVLLVAPAQHLRAVCGGLARAVAPGTPLVVCAKGIEIGTGLLMSDLVAQVLPGHPVAVLSGPTFAIEVARQQPTAVTLACADAARGATLAAALNTRAFRVYRGSDVTG